MKFLQRHRALDKAASLELSDERKQAIIRGAYDEFKVKRFAALLELRVVHRGNPDANRDQLKATLRDLERALLNLQESYPWLLQDAAAEDEDDAPPLAGLAVGMPADGAAEA